MFGVLCRIVLFSSRSQQICKEEQEVREVLWVRCPGPMTFFPMQKGSIAISCDLREIQQNQSSFSVSSQEFVTRSSEAGTLMVVEAETVLALP